MVDGRSRDRSSDIKGMIFGRLKVLRRDGLSPKRRAMWLCVCECGITKRIAGVSLRRGETRSCGCLQKEFAKGNPTNVTHNMSSTPEYRAWSRMKQRCLNDDDVRFHRYGGRGVKVCDRWLISFENFFKDVGPMPSIHHSLDRVDNDGDYKPENVQWATDEMQANNRSTNKIIDAMGMSMTVAQWSKSTGINESTILSRLSRGWDHSLAVTQEPKS